MAAIEPRREPAAAARPGKKTSQKVLLALPKGLVDEGETPEQAALREVLEETGLVATPVVKLADSKYVYVRSWGDGERVFKIVSFYLLRAGRGRIGEIEDAMRVEVAEARWLPLDEAPRLLSYGGEREMAAKARDRLGT